MLNLKAIAFFSGILPSLSFAHDQSTIPVEPFSTMEPPPPLSSTLTEIIDKQLLHEVEVLEQQMMKELEDSVARQWENRIPTLPSE